MATVIYVKHDTKSVVGMSRAIDYVQQDYKTTVNLEDGTTTKLVSGQNANPETAFDKFRATKRIYGKSGKVQFYHVVQSFSPEEEVPPETVHEAGVRLAKYFDGFEVIIATHIDKDHHHNHLIINSVNAETGKKLSEGIKGIYDLRRFSDNICKDLGLSVLEDKKSKVKGMKTGEFRAALKGDSWKFKLIGVIDNAMSSCNTKDEFIKYMEYNGYQVKWTDSRKYITYTSPKGRDVRDNKLHDEKYLKENMEQYFADKQLNNDKNSSLHIETAILSFGHNDSDDYIFSSAPTDNLEGLKDNELLIAFKNRHDMQEHIKAYNELVEIQKRNEMNFEITLSLIDEFIEKYYKNYKEEDEEDLEL